MGRFPRLIAVAALAALAGCGFDGSVGPGYQCGEGDWCPAGQSCVGGVCTAGGPEIDAGPGAPDAAPDAGPPAPRCGTLDLLRDDFADGSIGFVWDAWSDVGASVDETGGDLVLVMDQGTVDAWAGVTSAARYDLTDAALEVEVVEVGGVYTLIELDPFGPGLAQIYVSSGTLVAKVIDTVRAEIPYQAAEHRYWRMRESGGTLFFETSPDRAVWNELHSEPMPFPVEHVRALLAAGGQLAGAASEARFGDINLEAAPDLRYCPASDLVDRFDDGALGPSWSRYLDPGCTAIESGGVFTMTFDGVGTDYCGISSDHWYDLRDSSVMIDAETVPGGPDFYAYFQVGLPRTSGSRHEIERQDDLLDIEQEVGGVEMGGFQTAWDPVAHRWWRIREAGGDIFFETSADGVAWTTRLTTTSGFDPSIVQIEIGAGHDTPGPGGPLTWTLPGVN